MKFLLNNGDKSVAMSKMVTSRLPKVVLIPRLAPRYRLRGQVESVDRFHPEDKPLTDHPETSSQALRRALAWRVKTIMTQGRREQARLMNFGRYDSFRLNAHTPLSLTPKEGKLWSFQALENIEFCLDMVRPSVQGILSSGRFEVRIKETSVTLAEFVTFLKMDLVERNLNSNLFLVASIENEGDNLSIFQQKGLKIKLILQALRSNKTEEFERDTVFKFVAPLAEVVWAKADVRVPDCYPNDYLFDPARAESFVDRLTWE